MGLHSLYERLPPPLKDVAATARGAQLVRSRYGPDTERLVDEAHEREQWDEARWDAHREERLAQVLHRAATRVPWYREHWAARRRDGDRSSAEDLANWPVLTKAVLRAQPQAFVADDVPFRSLITDHTSGTTGTPLTLWFDKPSVHAWYALFEARVRRWHGVDRRDPVGMLGGQVVVPTSRSTPPYWVRNRAMHQLYLSVHHIRADHAPAYARAMQAAELRYLLGYTSALTALARSMDEAGIDAPKVDVSITNAEPVTTHDRATISGAFGGPVRMTYGMAEVVAAAMECTAGTLHDFPEVGWLEHAPGSVRRDDEPAGVGDLLATGLVNDVMPLIRYQVGDRMALPRFGSCVCGRTLPIVDHVSGRSDDVVWTPDGRAVGRLDPVFKADLPILEAQIVQEDLHHIEVRIVAAPGWTADHARSVADRTRERVGDVDVVVTVVPAIARTAGGKFRAVISKVERP